MMQLDINMLPWHSRRHKRWRRQRDGLYIGVAMLVGWWGCAQLWHDGWCNHYAQQILIRLRQSEVQQAQIRLQSEARVAAEQWREQTVIRQRQRQQDQQRLGELWQALVASSVGISSVNWQPDQVQLEVINPTQRPLESPLRSVSSSFECHALSDAVIQCSPPLANGEASHD